MKTSSVLALAVVLLSTHVFALIGEEEDIILVRGDANSDGAVDTSDAIYLNAYIFGGGPAPPCLNQADANDDNSLDISDSTYLFNWLFRGGPAPPAPGPYNTECTTDSTYLGCAQNPCS